MEPGSKKKIEPGFFFAVAVDVGSDVALFHRSKARKVNLPPIVSQMCSENKNGPFSKTAFFFCALNPNRGGKRELQTHCSAKIASLIFAR